ncbi:MAG: M14 family metallopeptidase [Pelobium sp.]
MKRILISLALLLAGFQVTFSQQKLQSPSEFLGYELGSHFTLHYKVVKYYEYLAANSKNVKLQYYGKTNEGRELLVAFVASDKNINRLDEIRKSNLGNAGIGGNTAIANQPAIVWLSYNVHGNESVSTEASMKTIYDLLDPSNLKTKEWLKNTVVVIDPCINPDGRDRYVNFYNPVANLIPDPKSYAREHREPWPGGRANHYLFDLNRDWAWQTQIETQQRLKLYNSWLPEIHVDFHEQGVNNPYYFAPAAEPYHDAITSWQREFQNIIGRNNAKYFDQKGWMYFTKEVFDLLYPSYGDTYPLYNGAIGMTFEQGGGGVAGLAVLNQFGDTLTLKDRIAHHYTAGLSTIEATSANAGKVVNEFKKFYTDSKTAPSGEYKTYVIKDDNDANLKKLAELLKNNGIEFGYGVAKSSSGFNYFTGKSENFSIEKKDLIVNAYQPKSVLARVLLEPRTVIPDSNTYDITAWALPYAYGLKAYALKESVQATTQILPPPPPAEPAVSGAAYAWVADWKSLQDVKFLAGLLKSNIKVRYSEVPFEVNGKKFGAGSLIIAKTSNEEMGEKLESTLTKIAAETGEQIIKITTGFVDKGADFGSGKIHYIQKPTVAVLAGDEVSSLAFGEVWHFFEQQIGYPITVIKTSDINRVQWNDIQVLIAPDGYYKDLDNQQIQDWIRSGGKLIAIEGAVKQLADKKGFGIKNKEEKKEDVKDTAKKDPYENIKTYADREREGLTSSIPGAIYKVDLDNTHPLAFGYPNYYYTLKLDANTYSFLENGWNVGTIKKSNFVTGFVGNNTKKKLQDGTLMGVEDMGRGSVIYLADDPLFRSFWENGKLLFSNAVFMVGQ